MTRIYSRKGDRGKTSAGREGREFKDAPLLEAVGTLDELDSYLGLAVSLGVSPELIPMLIQIQNDLFVLGSMLSCETASSQDTVSHRVEEAHVKRLEGYIDDLSASLDSLDRFILPGGSLPAAVLHLARVVCRRAQRRVVTLHRSRRVPAAILSYLNRLSDLLFVMARFQNRQDGIVETEWPGKE